MKSQNSLFLTATRRYLFSPRVRSQFIKLPLNLLKFRKTLEVFFFKIAGFPEIVGARDGTNIQIIVPFGNENVNKQHQHTACL